MKRVVRRSGLANGALTCPVILASTGLLCWLWPATLSAAGAISYVQGNYAVPQTSQTTVTVTFSAAQSAGDLNVVVVGWNDSTATVSTVVDTRGNMYTRAVGPTVVSGALSQSIYYAKNIAAAAAGANTVTVTFSKAANSADIRILEYSGADVSNPVDITARASGNNANSSSGAVTTTNATDLVFGANIVVTSTNGPGSGFTQRLLTSPDGDIAEDRFVTATGSYSATAPLDSSGRWIMQMVAFRAAGSAVGVAPAITSGSSTTFVVGTMGSFTVMATGTPTPSLTETGALPSGVTFKDNGNGTATLGGTPTTGTAGSYAITITAQNGVPPNATQSFTLTVNQAPTITSVNNTTFTVGTAGSFAVTATGTPTPSLTETGALPAGATFKDNGNGTATLGGTPATGTAGSYPITITAHNGIGSDASQNFTLTVSQAAASIAFVQVNSATPQTAQTSVTVVYKNAQTAGDLNVVVVGWNDSTTQVSSITDSKGNGYALAVGPTVQSGTASQAIYYARNIVPAAASGNSVTVTFSKAASSADIRVAEFSGIDTTNPVDVAAAAQGTGTPSNSGSVTTGNPNDLLVGANLVQQSTTGPGSGYTIRVITTPDSDILEDSIVTTAGSHSATATISGGAWIMQMVAFRAAGGGVGVAPSFTSGNSTTFAVGATGNFTVTATGTPTPSITEMGALPSGVAFKDNGNGTATLSGTPSGGGGTYSLTLTANNGVGTPGSQSFTLTITLDTQAPTAPSGLTATAISGSQINLSWTASTDNVGVTGYLIERCQGAGCTNFARVLTVTGTTYSDSGLISNMSYTYQVKATDAAGNFSPYSNTATATTLATIAGLVAAYSFDEGTGTTVTDLSGNGNTGTLTNTTWTSTAKFGNALVFNGSNSKVSINDAASLHLTAGMTLEAWVNPYVLSAAWRDIIYKGNDNYFLEGTSDTGAAAGGGTFGSADVTTHASTSLPANSWSHLALTYDGATLRIYVNGAQVSNIAQTGSILTSTNPLEIGGDSIFGQYFAGTIDEVRVYNVPLNQTQIQSDMVTPVSGSGSLPLVSLDNLSVGFGNQATGTTSSPQVVTLTNVGGAQLAITSIAISGGNVGEFAETNNCGSTLASGGSCAISVTFAPTTTGARSSSVLITDNAPGSPHSVSLSGTGTGFGVTPRVVALTFTRTQQFIASSGGATWSVDGAIGGSASSGTITSAGLYSPPSSIGTHVVTATTSSQSASATVYVTNYSGTFTFHNDNLRTGQNTSETVLNLSNVNQAQFGNLFSYPLDGLTFASPLYVANVNVPGQGFHNVVYVATEHDSVYAWDADGLSTNPLWKVSFLGSGVTTVPCGDTGECGDIPTEIGITGTPAIDQAGGTLYVVAKTKEGASYVQRLHALDITTGAERFGGPVVIQASVIGSGMGSQGNQLPFDPLRENQRPALLLSNGVVYIAWAAHGDQQPWHGWVIAYNATTLQQTMSYCVSPDGYGGGIWMSNGGLATDSGGNIFFTTGNGDFTVNTGGQDYGDSIVKLSASGSVVDYFTPHDQANMEAQNFDLSSAGPVLLVDQPGSIPHLLVAAAKTGTIFVVNRDNMGHYNSSNDNQIVQSLVSVLPNGTEEEGNYSAPVFFNGYVYFAAVNDNLKAFQLSGGLLSSGPTSQSGEIYLNRGGSFAVSSNGNSNGIVWAVQDNSPSNAVLFAYDASNLSHELYNSTQLGARDTLGLAMKFNIPLVANGKVFVVVNGQLMAYGLLP